MGVYPKLTAARRVLVIKQGALGDVIMATALIRAILDAHPQAAVHLLTTPPYAALFSSWPGLNVTALPRRGWRATWQMLRFIRGQHFDCVYDLQANDRTGVLCALSGIPIRIGNPPRFPYNVHPAERWSGETHIFSRMLEVLAAAGIHDVPSRPFLPCSETDRAAVDAFLARHRLQPKSFAVLHAGASPTRPEKRWPGFGALAMQLRSRGIGVVWLGGPDDAALNRGLAAESDIDASGVFSIPALAELATHARFAVTNDSGPMHACAAAGIPVFALFGPSDWRRNHALGQAGHVIAGVSLLPDLAGERTAECLDRISPDTVLAIIASHGLL